MNKLYTLLIAAMAFYTTTAQTNVYHPFPDSNAIWNEGSVSNAGCGPFTPLLEWYSYLLTGDTLIKGVQYHKLMTPFIASNCASNMPTGYRGGIRQEIQNKKVFFVQPNDSVDYLLYDFNLQVGDTLR